MFEIRSLIWDSWNIDHIQRHAITQDEVEAVCHTDCLVLDGHHGRILLVGTTSQQRLLTIVLDPEPEAGRYYPVTARPASHRERRLYQAEKGGEDTHDQAA